MTHLAPLHPYQTLVTARSVGKEFLAEIALEHLAGGVAGERLAGVADGADRFTPSTT